MTAPLHATILLAMMAAPLFAGEPVPLGEPLLDFRRAPVGEEAPYTSWRWTAEMKARAPEFTRLAVEPSPDGDGTVLRITINDSFPWGTLPEHFRIVTSAQFPPETDAVVMRCRVLDGEFGVSVGSPTAYFADSDVMAAVQVLRPGDWQDVVFDLNHGLIRNYRRAGFGRHARSIAYTRWAQESPALLLMRSRGTMLVRDIRLVARGEGRPFPVFNPDEVEIAQAVDVDASSLFSLFQPEGRGQLADFTNSWKAAGQPRYPPPRFSFVPGPSGRDVPAATASWAEELRWMGVKTPEVHDANAIRLEVRLSTELPASVAGYPDVDHAVDIGVLATPLGKPFPYEAFAIDPAERDEGVRGHDCLYSPLISDQVTVATALHTTRRFVAAGRWTTLVIPLADFVCVGSTGPSRHALENRLAPVSGEVRAVLALVPFPRQGRLTESTLAIGSIAFVKVPDDKAGPSYFRPVPGEFTPLPDMNGYGGYVQAAAPPSSTQPEPL